MQSSAVLTASPAPNRARGASPSGVPRGPRREASLTTFLPGLAEGDRGAIDEITRRMLPRVLRVVERKLRGLRAADADRVADSVFVSLWRTAADGRFDRDSFADSDALWGYLMKVADSKSIDYARFEGAQKRDVRRTRGEGSIWRTPAGEEAGPGFDRLNGSELRPDDRAAFAEAFEEFMAALPNDQTREIVCLKLEGRSVEEIADATGWSTRTVKRKLAVTRGCWKTLHGGGGVRKPR